MPQQSELRVFISSTFQDLQEEREHLVKKIFPEIRALCRSRGVTFTDVDLRWGLTEEEGLLGRIIRTCLEEVDKCRPYFIGMIGNRYGWVPELHDVMIDPDLLAAYPFVEDLAIEGTSVTEIEFIHGVFEAPQSSTQSSAQSTYFYHRKSNVPIDPEEAEPLAALIRRVEDGEYPLRQFSEIEELGEMVRDDLIGMIQEHWPETEAPSPLDIERRSHAAFAASRVRAYIPNAHHLKEFNAWIREGEEPLLIHGSSGLGKSSLVAYLASTFRRKNREACTIEHYVGASDGSGSAISIMRHVIEEICRHFEINDEIPENSTLLQRSFPSWLHRAARLATEQQRPLLLVIDAVNQLGVEGQRMNWLPHDIPTGVKLLVSSTPGETLERLKKRSWRGLELLPLDEERLQQSIVVRYLGEFHKGVSPEQLRRLTGDEKGNSPLFLRIVAEELRLHGEHESLDEVIDRYVGSQTMLEVFDKVLERIEVDFGRTEVSTLLRLIGISQSGLSETELLALSGFSRMDLSRLLFALDYHLLRKNGLLGFFHDYLRRAVENRYLGDEAELRVHRLSIAGHFETLPLDQRVAHEILFQYAQAGEDDQVVATLCNEKTLTHLFKGVRTYEVYREWARLRENRYDPVASYREIIEGPIDENSQTARLESMNQVAGIFYRISLWSEAMSIQERILEHADEQGSPRIVAQSSFMIGVLLQMRGENDNARPQLERAARLYREIGDLRGAAVAVGSTGVTYHAQGNFDKAIECYEQRLAYARELDDSIGITTSLTNIGCCIIDRGHFHEARPYLEEAMEVAQDGGDRIALGTAAGNYGLICRNDGDLEEGLKYHRVQAEVSEEMGDRHSLSMAEGNMGVIYLDQGDFTRARDAFEKKLAIGQELGDRRGICQCLGSLGALYYHLGEFDEALSWFTRELDMAEEDGDGYQIAHASGNSALVYLARNESDMGLASIARAIEEARAVEHHDIVATFLCTLSEILIELVAENDRTGDGKMPDYLPALLQSLLPTVDLQPERWQASALNAARQFCEEASEISHRSGKLRTLVSSTLLRAWIDAAVGDTGEARIRSLDLLARSEDDEDMANISYWLWRVETASNGEEEEMRRAEGLRLNQQMIENRPGDFLYAKRVAEMEFGGETE